MGEHQRLAIARALVEDPRLVILDEATSALDDDTQAELQEALANLTHGRTKLVIAHRPEAVAGADRIVVLRDGCLVERQTRALLRNEGE